MLEEVIFLDRVHLQVDPQIRVADAEEVHEAGGLDKVFLLGECDEVDAQLPHELLERLLLQVGFLELAEIAQEDIQGNRNVLLVEASREHLVHEVVDLVG